jgi:hypothetical protein
MSRSRASLPSGLRLATLGAMLALSLNAGAVSPPAHVDETKPWSQLELPIAKRSNPDEFSVRVLAVNGYSELDNETVRRLLPGEHVFQLTTAKPGRIPRHAERIYTLTMAPCMRYELVAVHTPSIDNYDWTPTLRATTPIQACLKKFPQAAAAS